MIKSLLLLASLLILTSCASQKVPDFEACITLPASGDGFCRTTVSKKERRVPAGEWKQIQKRGITILSSGWTTLKVTIKQNCSIRQCTELVGFGDELFLTIDNVLDQME